MRSISRPRRRLDVSRRWLACLCLLPLALAGVGAGAGLWLLHEHGSEGLHGHAGPLVAAGDPHAADSWHGGASGTFHGHAPSEPTTGDRGDEDVGAPDGDDGGLTLSGHDHGPGVLVERPVYLALARPAWLACLESLGGAEPMGPHAMVAPAAAALRTAVRPPGDAEPCGLGASGAIRVLRTSHALLI